VSLDWIYYAISWILLNWHTLWEKVVPARAVLGTNWTWILSIVFLVLTIRLLIFPVFVKQIRSQRAMQALQPQMKALQEKHKNDKQALQREMMELYRTEKVNPLMGCLPMLLQAPVFLGLLHVLRRLKPDNKLTELYGWTAEKFNSATHSRLFDAPIAASFNSTAADLAKLEANGLTVKLVAGTLVAIMVATTYLSSKQMILKTGWSEDPQQKMIQRLMLYGIPLSLLISGGIFPIGVVIYWVISNLFSLGQQAWVLSKYPPPKMATGKVGTAQQSGGKAPAVDAKVIEERKALAPKPGAKPVNTKKAAGRPANRPKKGGVKGKAGQ